MSRTIPGNHARWVFIDLFVAVPLLAAAGCVTQGSYDSLARDLATAENTRDLIEDRCVDYELEIGAWEARVFGLEMQIKIRGEQWEKLSAQSDEYVSQIEQLTAQLAELGRDPAAAVERSASVDRPRRSGAAWALQMSGPRCSDRAAAARGDPTKPLRSARSLL